MATNIGQTQDRGRIDFSNIRQEISAEDVQNSISALDAINIHAVAKMLAIGVLGQILCDTQNDSSRGNQHDDLNSKLMEILLPAFIKQIQTSFSLPSEFMEKGIQFVLINADKKGLLDQIEDKKFQGEIAAGKLSTSSSLHAVLKYEGCEQLNISDGSKTEVVIIPKFQIDYFSDGKLADSSTKSMQDINSTHYCLIP